MDSCKLFEKLESYIDWGKYLLTRRQMKKLREDLEAYSLDDGTVSDELLDFFLWCEGRPSRTKRFADYLDFHLLDYCDGTILDVGCGPKALLARELSDRGYNVEAIDPLLETPGKLYRRESFTIDYPKLKSYNAVVALEPCEAAEVIVRACTEYDKPFFLVPCGVPHDRLGGKCDNSAEEWWKYLQSINPSIRFSTIALDRVFRLPVLSNG